MSRCYACAQENCEFRKPVCGCGCHGAKPNVLGPVRAFLDALEDEVGEPCVREIVLSDAAWDRLKGNVRLVRMPDAFELATSRGPVMLKRFRPASTESEGPDDLDELDYRTADGD